MSVEELAVHVAAAERGCSLLAVDEPTVAPVRTALEHVHLPKLAAVDLVDRGDHGVVAADHPALQSPAFERIVGTTADGWDDVLACLANRRRRTVLAVLADREGPTALDELAQAVAVHERADVGDGVRDLRVDLHHVHLPKLSGADLVEYDPGAHVATYQGHPALPEAWLAFGPEDPPRPLVTDAERSRSAWRLEGRGQVSERGRALCAYADDELFVMVTAEGLLETACIRSLRDAADRGVDVYLGAGTATLRERLRDAVPGATIWTPQRDWLDLPPAHGTVGRLVLADREAVMLGTVVGAHETAITGTGENNALVLLLRGLVGPQLDGVDDRSGDVRTELPL